MGVELIQWRYSTTAGAAGNSQAQPDPNASLGKYVSTTPWTGVSGLFGNQLTSDQSDEVVDHRCVFVANLNGTIALRDTTIYFPGQLPSMSTIEIGLDPKTASAVGAEDAQALEIASETAAPPGVVFSQPMTPADGLPLGDLEIGATRAVWVRRTPSGAASAVAETFVIRAAGTLTP